MVHRRENVNLIQGILTQIWILKSILSLKSPVLKRQLKLILGFGLSTVWPFSVIHVYCLMPRILGLQQIHLTCSPQVGPAGNLRLLDTYDAKTHDTFPSIPVKNTGGRVNAQTCPIIEQKCPIFHGRIVL